jgi:3-oxo-5alpha-steroid 4-dehydrogenase
MKKRRTNLPPADQTGTQEKSLTRREFVKLASLSAGAAALAAAGSMTGCDPVDDPHDTPRAWDMQADVVIVGFGAAGAAAAIEARNAGAGVIVLEKMSAGGGSTRMCGGIIYMGGGTAVQQAAGFSDTRDDMFSYLSAAAGEGADPDMIGLYCDTSLELYDWLVQQQVPFKKSFLPGKYAEPPTDDGLIYSGNELQAAYRFAAAPVPRGHHVQGERSTGYRLWQRLEAAVNNSGARIVYGAAAEMLLLNAENRVTGVTMKQNGIPRYVKALRAVILCAGGFALNKDMVRQYCPEYLPSKVLLGTPGDDGAGIRMGQAAGAAVRLMQEGFTYAAAYVYDPGFVNGIYVNDRGRRFIGEDNYGEWVGEAIMSSNPAAWLIIDETMLQAASSRAQGLVKALAEKADSIAALAAALRIPSAALEDTVRLYNTFTEKGEDPDFQKAPEYLAGLNTPPFYGLDFSAATVSFFTTGGLTINQKAQVLNSSGQPITGLYAAGRNAASGVIARNYPGSGVSVGDALVFGRIAGRQAAALPAA